MFATFTPRTWSKSIASDGNECPQSVQGSAFRPST